MTGVGSGFLETAVTITMGLLLVGGLLGSIRLIRGPGHADRIVALDMISTLVVSLLAVTAIDEGAAVYLDVAIAYALIAYLGTISLARYLQRFHKNQSGQEEVDEP
jgi:multisubunit Na+/H+ antiporter MnhF subunit